MRLPSGRGPLLLQLCALMICVMFVSFGVRKFIGHATPWKQHALWGIPPALTYLAAVGETAAGLLILHKRWTVPAAAVLSLFAGLATSLHLGQGDTAQALPASIVAVAIMAFAYLAQRGKSRGNSRD